MSNCQIVALRLSKFYQRKLLLLLLLLLRKDVCTLVSRVAQSDAVQGAVQLQHSGSEQ